MEMNRVHRVTQETVPFLAGSTKFTEPCEMDENRHGQGKALRFNGDKPIA